MARSELRRDLEIYNEATGFVVTSGGLAGKGFEPGSPDWKRAVEQGELLAIELVQDDTFIVRVTTGELAADEAEEWVGRFEGRLRVPDGKLVVAGGFEYVAEGPAEDDMYSLAVDVPPGDYRVELLAYLPGVNGDYLLDRAKGKKEPLGAWFRRTRGAKKPFPAWLQQTCRSDPAGEDPGHEDEWRKKKELPEAKTPLLDFLLRLSPLEGRPPKLEAPKDGFFSPDAFETRRPEKCPIGIGSKERTQSFRTKRPQEPAEPRPVPTVDVLSRVASRKLYPVRSGRPVELPIANLVQIYRLAWLATDSADPEIRIELPKKSTFELDVKGIDGIAASREGTALRIGFAESGAKWAQTHAVDHVAKRLEKLPPRSVLELMTAPEPEPDQHKLMGLHRYRGNVASRTWRIEETSPEVDAALLSGALAFSRAIEGGKSLELRTDNECKAVDEELEVDAVLFRENPATRAEEHVTLRKKDAGLLHFLAIPIFRVRFENTWPARQPDPSELEEVRARAARRKAQEAELRAKVAAEGQKRAAKEGAFFEGKIGKFMKVDYEKERPGEEKFLRNFDQQMKALGYRNFTSLVVSRFSNVVIRAYAREKAGTTWGLLMSTSFSGSLDFVSYFEDGAALTTTTTAGQTLDEPEKAIYRTRLPEIELDQVAKLHAAHEKRVTTLAKKLGEPRSAPADERVLCEGIDAAVAKQLGI